ncbi:MFS transporter [Pseudomonas fulva]|uniref:MFS transporter n=1 Tax=Pseudomonas fulva TaxID=47880 RepID=UPI00201E6D31|nr:MFS transporter [Pseudomonas fulva]UQY33009.1 MFS transporter [Pseudomonas fulva]
MNSNIPKKIPLKVVIATAIGNYITWFEFASYGFLAVVISRIFFPMDSPGLALLMTFGAFGVSFLMAPLGALFFGRLGDTVGRKRILVAVILLMSGSTFAIGLLPTYETLGVAAPIILVLFRMLQGFASGGEPGGAATVLAESAAPARRAMTVSVWHCSSFLANASASALVFGLTSLISEEALEAWGWRIPFLLAGALGVIAYLIRRQLEETPTFLALEAANEKSKSPIKDVLSLNLKEVLQTTGCMAFQGAAFYFIFVYIETYLRVELDLNYMQASISNIACLCAASVSIFLFAYLSDQYGRRAIMLMGAALSTAIIYPVFLAFSTKEYSLIILGHTALGICLATFMSASGAALVEIFPAKVRYAGFSIAYGLAIAIFGGSSAFIATWLISLTGSPLSPSILVIATGLIAIISVVSMRETAPAGLKKRNLKLANT